MKEKNQKIQTPSLFDDSVSCINVSSNDLNIVHNKTVTSAIVNNIQKLLKSKKFAVYNNRFEPPKV